MNTYLMFVIFINSNIDKQIKTCAYEIIFGKSGWVRKVRCEVRK